MEELIECRKEIKECLRYSEMELKNGLLNYEIELVYENLGKKYSKEVIDKSLNLNIKTN